MGTPDRDGAPARRRPPGGGVWRETLAVPMALAALLLASSCARKAGNSRPGGAAPPDGSFSSSDDGADRDLARPDGPTPPTDMTPADRDSLDTRGNRPDLAVGTIEDATGTPESGGRDAETADAPFIDAPLTDATTRDAAIPDATTRDATVPDALGAEGPVSPSPFRVLLFSRTVGFRHGSIPAAIAALMMLQSTGGFVAQSTEDPSVFTPAGLAPFQVIVFLMTTGDVLDPAQQVAFEQWVAAGGGYVGIHSASDTEYDWPFYGQLVGAYFRVHPAIQTATIRSEAPTHPIMVGVPATWVRSDEWYDFVTNPRPNVTVLATVDESTYAGGTMGPDHPIAWVHATSGGGRAFYTALGHTDESYSDATFRRHLVNGLRWVANR